MPDYHLFLILRFNCLRHFALTTSAIIRHFLIYCPSFSV